MGTPGCQVFKVGKGSEGLFLHVVVEMECLLFNSYTSMILSASMGLCQPSSGIPQIQAVPASTL